MSLWVKDPADTAWYQFEFGGDPTATPPIPPFLAAGETITSHTITVDANLTKVSDAATNTAVLIQVTGGTNETQSLVTCDIHTSELNVYAAEKYIDIVTRIVP